MLKKFIPYGFFLCCFLFSELSLLGVASVKKNKHVLLLNSYQQGFNWTDSLNAGIIKGLTQFPEVVYYVEELNSKQFGQINFDLTAEFFAGKYSGINFDGVLVTDNDALDFTIKYRDSLFPNRPVVFMGVSNPEDYALEGLPYYGFIETVGSKYRVDFVKRIIPDVKRLLVVTDLSTTGKIYRSDFKNLAGQMPDFDVIFPKIIDQDSVAQMLASDQKYDAIYYVASYQDREGKANNYVAILDSICKYAQVPIFADDQLLNGRGVLGGSFQSGDKQGVAAAKMLVALMDSTQARPAQRIIETSRDHFFDQKILDRYRIPVDRIPQNSIILHKSVFSNPLNLLGLIGVLVVLSLVIVFLSVVNRRRRVQQQKSNLQILQIEKQKEELEDAQLQMSKLISDLENANTQMLETNQKLELARKKAEESDNLKSAFLANVSHEIRTPLNSIIGFSSLIVEPGLSENEHNRYKEIIESNSESLLVLIDEIIDLSKIEAGQLTLKKKRFDMDLLINELWQIFDQNNDNPEVEFKVNIPTREHKLFVFSDRVRIKQIFTNILSNALKFTSSGFIEVGYQFDKDQQIIFYVKDTGIGISKEFHQAIFHRFRKLNENSGKIFRGTGLGLAITQKLIGLLGGKIWLDSEPEIGTTFYFTIQDCELEVS